MDGPAPHHSIVSTSLFRNKVNLLLGHGVFLALLVLSWQHALVRSTNADSAFQFFKWVNYDGLNIEAHRYGAVLPQFAVKAARALGCGLSGLMHVSSMAHVLVGYAVFSLSAHGLKSKVASMACALAAVLATRLTFYSPVLEANYLVCFPLLLFAAIDWRKQRSDLVGVRGWGAIAVVSLPTLFVHPLGWLSLVAIAWLSATLGYWTGRDALRYSCALLLLAISIRVLLPPTDYEDSQYGLVVDGLNKLDSIARWASTQFVLDHVLRITNAYLPLMVLCVALPIAWAIRGGHTVALATVTSWAVFFGLYLLLTRAGDTAVMMERGLLPIATVLAVSLMGLFALLQGKHAWLGTVMLALIFFVKLRDISFASRQFMERYASADVFAMECVARGERKVCLSADDMTDIGLQSTWALPVEVLLISAIQGPEHAVCIFQGASEAACENYEGLKMKEHEIALPEINSTYFRLPSGPYVRLAVER